MPRLARLFLVLLSTFGLLATAQAGPRHRRVTLLSLSVEGYAPYRDRHSYFDVGVEEIPHGQAPATCELLDPRPSSRVAAQPWAPIDFYGNVLNASEQRTFASQLGEPDVFFPGDDGNRNGGTAGADWTMQVPSYLTDSLEFTERRREKDWVTTRLAFIRGGLRFDGLIGVRASLGADGCTAKAYLCTAPLRAEGRPLNCRPDGWGQTLTQVIAIADLWGGARDKFRRIARDRDRNDLSALDAVVSDAAGTRRVRLAEK